MSKIEVNTVDVQCGSTLTLGSSGKTVQLATGASQSGFGRTGTVDWQTTVKTSTFTATSGEGYFCDTSSGGFTVNLPSSPSVGDIVAIKDYSATFDTQNLTIGRGGSNLNGTAADSVRNTENESLTMVYADATKGWLAVEEGTGFLGQRFITATGGTETTSGDFKIHTFTGPGTFNVTCGGNASGSSSVDYLVVAGGGGTTSGGPGATGGGGGGGFRASSGTASGCYTAGPGPLTSPVSALPVSVQAYPITVGAGGSAGPTSPPGLGTNGSNSIFSTITSTGGGFGGGSAGSGGSGGGGCGGASNNTGGSGNTPPTSPSQGNDGGDGNRNSSGPSATYRGGGGGGATAQGTDVSPPQPTPGGPGGAGATSCITASPVDYAAGGGGGAGKEAGGLSVNGGTAGGPSAAAGGARNTGNDAPNNQGGGGGGAGYAGSPLVGGAGGSGIVVIRYKFQ